jgi:4-diphosphocytidyl-2-C-methyl-D-erythritol kinase
MSGSGASCFALFDSAQAASAGAAAIHTRHPAWWVKTTSFGSDPIA